MPGLKFISLPCNAESTPAKPPFSPLLAACVLFHSRVNVSSWEVLNMHISHLFSSHPYVNS